MKNPTDRRDKDDEVIAPGSEQARIAETQMGRAPKLPSTARQFAKTAEINPPLPVESSYKSPEESYSELPSSRKSMMQLGLNMPHTDYEFKEGKELGSKKVIAITTNSPEESAKLASDITSSGIALSLETPIIHGPNSSSNTEIYLVPNPMNAHAITAASERLGIPALVRVSGHTQGIVRFSDQLLPIDPSLLAHTPVSTLERSQLQSAHWKPGDIRDYTVSADHAKKPQQFGEPFSVSRYMASNSLQLAQKDGRIEGNITEETSYLILDISKLLRETTSNLQVINILNKLASLSASPEFLVSLDQQGHLVIINRAQRGGSFMTRLAAEIEKSTNGKSNIIIGKGILKKQDNHYDIENYPNRNTIIDWERQGTIKPRTFLTQSTAQTLTSGRDATTVSFEVDVVDGSDLLALRDVKRNAKLHISGPDKFIGLDKELEQTSDSIDPSSNTKLTILNGSAGCGKSRLANEALKNHPNALIHSIDASGENIPGAALAEMSTTIKEAVDAKLPEDVKVRHYVEISVLKNYAGKSNDQKLKEAQTSPQSLVELYLRCLTLLEKTCGSFLLVIDDVHHIDRHSESYMMTMLEKFLTQTQSKAMIMRRPEETYHSVAQTNLASNIHSKCRQRDQSRGIEGNNSYVKSINLSDQESGKPKLDIRDPKIAYEYAFHSLPVSLRLTETGEPRNLGNWPAELAKKCRTPFDFTSILNSLLEDSDSFIIGSDNIALSPEKKDALSAVNNDRDLLSYHQNRMRRLPDNAKRILQCVAILGTKVSYKNLQGIASEVLGIDQAQISTAIFDLNKGGYIVQHEEGGFNIQHDNYRDIAIGTLNQKDKRDIIEKLYSKLNDDPTIHNDKKFALLCEISDTVPFTQQNKTFWNHYCARANEAMQTAEKERAFGRGYSIGMTILNGLEKDDTNTLSQALEKLKANPAEAKTVPTIIKELIIKALFAIAKNGLNLGNFGKTTEAIDTLELLEADQFLTEAYVIGFRAAHLQVNVGAMEKYYSKAKIRPDFKPSDDLSMQIRLAFKKESFKECERLFTLAKDFIESIRETDPQASDEFERLRQRILVDQTRKNLENDEGVDGDVVSDPTWLDSTKTQEFIDIQTTLGNLNALREAEPDRFDPIQELQLRDQMAELSAFLGNYQSASESLREVWRLAQQMQIPAEAARASKLKGDFEIMQAISQIQYPNNENQGKARAIPNGTILRNNVLKAIRTYTENGFAALEKLEDKNDFQLIIRGQRMRAVSILVRSYSNEIEANKSFGELMSSAEQIKSELLPHLKTALEDFDYISKSPNWGKTFITPGLAGPYSYYGTSSMGHILQCIKDLGITEQEIGIALPNILDDKNFAAFNPESIEEGLKFAAMMKDNVGETDQGKLPGLEKIIRLGEQEALKQGEVVKTERFSQLKETHQRIVSQRS